MLRSQHCNALFLFVYIHCSVPSYRRWIKDIEELQTVRLNFAVLADPDCAVLASVSVREYCGDVNIKLTNLVCGY